jgi:carboxyl-terminal processing protease
MEDDVAARLEALWRPRLGRRALLIDRRGNGGGAEARAYPLVAPLVDAPRIYARRRVRTGPAPTDLSPPIDAWIRPGEGAPFPGPVVVLIGPGCVSSGEGMAQMLRAIPGVTFVGAPTRGASGNPGPVDLPNGLSVWFSRWVNELPDGTAFENRGVAPDVAVAFSKDSPSGDAVFDAGVKLLRERLAASPGPTAPR